MLPKEFITPDGDKIFVRVTDKLLGKGGFGKVYEGVSDNQIGQNTVRYAVKCIKRV